MMKKFAKNEIITPIAKQSRDCKALESRNKSDIENRIAENERYENNVSRTTKYLLISKKMTDNAKIRSNGNIMEQDKTKSSRMLS